MGCDGGHSDAKQAPYDDMGILNAAETAASDACACKTKDCARDVVSKLNKRSFHADDEKAALSDEDKQKFSTAIKRMDECRDALK